MSLLNRGRRTRLFLEALEDRIVPTAPDVMFYAEELTGNQIRISGDVYDEDPSSVSVDFSGVASGQVVPDTSGYFELTTTATGPGELTAVITDAEQSTSTVIGYFSSMTPSLSLMVYQTGNGPGEVNISGSVTDEQPGGRTVVLTGVVTANIVTDEYGSFSYTTTAGASGDITATVTDPFGQQSDPVTGAVYNNVPTVMFSVSQSGPDEATISGTVGGDYPGGATVVLSGVVSGSVVTDEYGYFWLTTTATMAGDVTATATDTFGQQSDPVTEYLYIETSVPSVPTVMLMVSQSGPDEATISGTVGGDYPGGATVVLSGVVSGSVVTDEYGYFWLTTTATMAGDVTATATDTLGQQSDPVTEYLYIETSVPSVPTVMLMVSQSGPDEATISGTVGGDYPGGATVVLSGVVSGSVVTDEYGYFWLTTTATMAGDVTAIATDTLGQQSDPVTEVLYNSAPGLTFSADQTGSGQVTITGSVSDEYPGGLTVVLTGVVSGNVVADEYGNFSLTTSVSAAGNITGTVTDAFGLQSVPVVQELYNSAPTVSFWAEQSGPGEVTITGMVTDEFPSGIPVVFSGAITGSVVTDADGNFSFTTSASVAGEITATATDSFGLESDPAIDPFYNAAPEITYLVAIDQGNNIWTFEGYVTDEFAAGLTIRLGGVSALNNQTATVDLDGYFSITVEVDPNEMGTVWAETADWFGEDSNTAMDILC